MPSRRKITKGNLKNPNRLLRRVTLTPRRKKEIALTSLLEALPTVRNTFNMRSLTSNLPQVNENEREWAKFKKELEREKINQLRKALKDAENEEKKYSKIVKTIQKVISKKSLPITIREPIITRQRKKFKPSGGAKRRIKR